jgi:nicotinamide phosphoribosyltransferase
MNIATRQEPTIAQQNGVLFQLRQKYGVVGDTDSYKLTHAAQYPKGATKMVSYFESRGGQYDEILWFGIEMICQEYLLQRLTQEQADNMVAWAREHMAGNVTDHLEIALNAVVNELGGRLPIKIRAAKEGALIPVKNVLFTIESTIEDERFFSIVSYFETKLVRAWGPSTVATVSYNVRKVIMEALERSADDPMAEIAFKFHDFGSRGVPDMGTAAFNGAGHLVSFLGTDTTVASMVTEIAYPERSLTQPVNSGSIPASEHSTTTMHGRTGEAQLVGQMFEAYAKPGAIFATVADSYDIISFLRDLAPKFRDQLLDSGATWVVRPDSNDPVEMPVQVIVELDKTFGSTINSKGYKVLNNVRCIQGDGIEPKHVKLILDRLLELGFSASNIAFGMGGGLLQKINRDTCKFALKCSAALINGEWVDVFKDPSTYDENWNRLEGKSFKKSKKGRLELMRNRVTGAYATKTSDNADEFGSDWEEALEDVFADGYMLRQTPFSEVRRNAGTFV